MNTELRAFLDEVRSAIEATLTELLPPQNERPERIHDAMRYSTMDGGKRIRPALCVAAFTAYKQDWKPVLRVAAAFEILARSRQFPPERMVRVISALASASGSSGGMIAGQVFDLESEGVPVTREQLEAIHRSKTAALIGVAVWIGSYLGGASEADLASIKTYCDRIGLAFQVIDDILDATDGQNRDEGKATYPGLYGLDQSRAIAHQLMKEARHALEPLGPRNKLLLAFCDYLEERTN